MSSPSILLVDDDPGALGAAALALRGDGFTVRTAQNGLEGLLAAEARTPDLVISDLSMPVMDGLDFLGHLRQRWPHVPAIVLTVSQEVQHVLSAMRAGAVDYLVKPAPPEALLTLVRRTLDLVPDRGRAAGAEVPRIVGRSRAIVEVRQIVALAAGCEVHVLITGRTGTGKELVAREIHRASRRSAGPFVAHNCAASPSELFESQFFGHRRGAFTGADRDQRGLLEQAHGGVLLLDELECLDPAHQAKLLRVLDDGEFRPVGSPASRHADVRILAATNTDPAEAIADGSLREDLYYRLRGIEVHLPPLGQRLEDLPLLAAHFLGPDAARLTPEALGALAGYVWPGGVRELRNVLRAALARADAGAILETHIGLVRRPALAARDAGAGSAAGATLDAIERAAVLAALREHRGNRSRAARALGIDRSTLRRKLRQAGASP